MSIVIRHVIRCKLSIVYMFKWNIFCDYDNYCIISIQSYESSLILTTYYIYIIQFRIRSSVFTVPFDLTTWEDLPISALELTSQQAMACITMITCAPSSYVISFSYQR